MTSHSFTVYRSPTIPFDVWKDLSNLNKKTIEEMIDRNNKNGEGKRSFFEITSIETSKRGSCASSDSNAQTPISSIHLSKVKSFERARCKVSDYRIPFSSVQDFPDRDFEFIDEKLKTIFSFCLPVLQSKPESAPIKECLTMNQRFIVKPHKSSSTDPRGVSDDLKKTQPEPKNLEVNKIKQSPSPITQKINNNSLISSSNTYPNTAEDLIKLAGSEPSGDGPNNTNVQAPRNSNIYPDIHPAISSSTNPPLVFGPSLTPNVGSFPPSREARETITPVNKENPLDYIFSANPTTINSEFPSKKSTGIDFDILAQFDLLNPCRDSANPPLSQPPFLTQQETYNRSLEKVTRSTFGTVSVLSNQMASMSEHVLELNGLVVRLKAENDRLQHELSRAINACRQPRKVYNIVQGEENNIYLTFEIIPGQLRCVNITKLLSLEELNAIRNFRK